MSPPIQSPSLRSAAVADGSLSLVAGPLAAMTLRRARPGQTPAQIGAATASPRSLRRRAAASQSAGAVLPTVTETALAPPGKRLAAMLMQQSVGGLQHPCVMTIHDCTLAVMPAREYGPLSGKRMYHHPCDDLRRTEVVDDKRCLMSLRCLMSSHCNDNIASAGYESFCSIWQPSTGCSCNLLPCPAPVKPKQKMCNECPHLLLPSHIVC